MQADRLSYPGLLPREICVLRAWLRLHEQEYDRVDYCVRVGEGTDPGPGYPEEIRRQAIANSQKRIDAIAWQGQVPTIVEVKDRAGASAIGQLVTYRALLPAIPGQRGAPRLMLVANRVAPDILPVIIENDITLQLVEADFSELRLRR